MKQSDMRKIIMNKKKLIEHVGYWAKIAGRIAELAILIRGKPKTRDFVALGISAIDMAMEIHKDQEKKNSIYIWDYFDGEDSIWERLPEGLVQVVFRHIEEPTKIEINLKMEGTIFNGKLGNEIVGWPSVSGNHADVPTKLYFKSSRREETMNALADVIWKNFKTNSLYYTTKGLTEMPPAPDDLIDTNFIENLFEKVKKFVEHKKPKGYLLEGVPGTGKSSCIRRIVEKMNMRALHIELSCFSEFADISEAHAGIKTILKILKPDVVVIDDVDLVPKDEQAKLLFLLEQARTICKIVFVTVNNRAKLLDQDEESERDTALLRPGRLDYHIKTPFLEPNIILQIIGEDDNDLVELMKEWPIRYIIEFAERKEVLGRDIARNELTELQRRIACIPKEEEEKITNHNAIGTTFDQTIF